MIKSFEGARGLAAVLVALFHLEMGQQYAAPLRHGYLFVDFFFVLSGFVICASYSSRLETIDQLKSFLIRRFGRLFPLLIFSTILYVCAHNAFILAKNYALTNGHDSLVSSNSSLLKYKLPSIIEIFSTLTLTHGIGFFDRMILNFVSWSISVEFYTYVLFAVVCLLLRGGRRMATYVALSIIALCVLMSGAILGQHDCLQNGACLDVTFDLGFARCIFSFFLGALAYHFCCAVGRDAMKSVSSFLQMAVLTAMGVLFSLVDTFPITAFTSPLIFSILVASLQSDIGPLATLLKTRQFQILGKRSYSIYMLHPVMLFAFPPSVKSLGGELGGIMIAAIYVIVLSIVSGWTFRFIEDPFRVLFNRLATRHDAAPVFVSSPG